MFGHNNYLFNYFALITLPRYFLILRRKHICDYIFFSCNEREEKRSNFCSFCFFSLFSHDMRIRGDIRDGESSFLIWSRTTEKWKGGGAKLRFSSQYSIQWCRFNDAIQQTFIVVVEICNIITYWAWSSGLKHWILNIIYSEVFQNAFVLHGILF